MEIKSWKVKENNATILVRNVNSRRLLVRNRRLLKLFISFYSPQLLSHLQIHPLEVIRSLCTVSLINQAQLMNTVWNREAVNIVSRT